jgi:hypothetical protein
MVSVQAAGCHPIVTALAHNERFADEHLGAWTEISLQIELDAFSGLPNSRWELTGAQAAEFLGLLRALRPAQGSHWGAMALAIADLS